MYRLSFIMAGVAVFSLGCPTVDLGDVPPDPGQCRPDPGYYEDVIWPEFLAPAAAPERSCVNDAGCHRVADGRSALRLADNPVDHDANYSVVTRFLNCGTPDASPLFTKPVSGVDAHGGGDLFAPADQTSTVFLQWFEL